MIYRAFLEFEKYHSWGSQTLSRPCNRALGGNAHFLPYKNQALGGNACFLPDRNQALRFNARFLPYGNQAIGVLFGIKRALPPSTRF